MPPDTRDQIVDFVRSWSDKTDIPLGRFMPWIGVGTSKFYDWKQRFGKVNEHNAWVPRDHWLTDPAAFTQEQSRGTRGYGNRQLYNAVKLNERLHPQPANSTSAIFQIRLNQDNVPSIPRKNKPASSHPAYRALLAHSRTDWRRVIATALRGHGRRKSPGRSSNFRRDPILLMPTQSSGHGLPAPGKHWRLD